MVLEFFHGEQYNPAEKQKMEDKMPKAIMVSYLELPTEENLSNYAPKAMSYKKCWGQIHARGMPVATYENGRSAGGCC